jgi:TRAP-type mannitol/chloroaromatic compound transport system substrate-binding protein
VAKYIVLPGVHQPGAFFELLINKKAWKSLSEKDQKLFKFAAKYVTLDTWLEVGSKDAKAYSFYQQQGNEIIELSEDVQKKARRLGIEWAEGQAKTNSWFKKVYESQKEFLVLWNHAGKYRNVKTN